MHDAPLMGNFSLLSSQNTAPAVWELQTGGASHRGGDAAPADPAEGRCAHLRDLPQDQVCRRLRPPLLLLPDQILRALWRTGLAALQQCEKPDLWPPPSPLSLSHSPHPCCSLCTVGPSASVFVTVCFVASWSHFDETKVYWKNGFIGPTGLISSLRL